MKKYLFTYIHDFKYKKESLNYIGGLLLIIKKINNPATFLKVMQTSLSISQPNVLTKSAGK